MLCYAALSQAWGGWTGSSVLKLQCGFCLTVSAQGFTFSSKGRDWLGGVSTVLCRGNRLTNLNEYFEAIAKETDESRVVDIINIDISKCFDEMLHAQLVQKRKAQRINGILVNCIQNWLVIWGRVYWWMGASPTLNRLSGVLQELVPGQLLVVIIYKWFGCEYRGCD